MHYVKFLRCSPEEYALLPIKNNDTLYFVFEYDENTAALYLGNKQIANGDISTNFSLSQLKDVFINEGLSHSQLLVYDGVAQAWINKSWEEAIPIFIGTNDIVRGKAGLVPVPKVGQKNFFLKGDGTWSGITADHVEVEIIEQEEVRSLPLTQVISNLQAQINNKTEASPIASVSSDFSIDNKKLYLNNLPISKIEGLEKRLSSCGEWDDFS